MKRCVIIGASSIKNYDRIKGYLKKDDFFVFCDGGLNHKDALGVDANLIVGDFDSFKFKNFNVQTIFLPREKDDTDTVYATKEMIKRGYDSFLFLAVTKKRLDHTLANLSILLMLYGKNKKAMIVDDFSEIEIVGKSPVYIEDKYKYFSLLNIYGNIKNVNIKNAKYNLENAQIKTDYQYAISNECLKGKTAEVFVEEGNLLLIKIIDE